MTDALKQIRTRHAITPQREQAGPRQVPNSAGGFTFAIPGEARIRRFLTLGVEGGTYYIKPRDLVAGNGSVLTDWARNRSSELVALATEISVAGRAPRNDPALFAVMAAMALGDEAGRRAAAGAFPLVARTGTHLLTAAKYLEQFRGWGPVARRAFARWYLEKDPDALAYQLVKYRHREDWTHRDVLRSAHSTRHADQAHRDLFSWVTRGVTERGELPSMVRAYERAREIGRGDGRPAAKAAAYVQLIRDVPGLPWEALPDEAVTQAEVWRALIDAGMPSTALMRQLPRLTRLGVFGSMVYARTVADQLRDPERLRKARIHPVSVLLALKTYAAGCSLQGRSTWTPVQVIADALDEAFYAAFPAVEPAGKRTMIATDTSGSMGWSVAGLPFRAVEVVGAMAMVTAATEPYWGIWGFATELFPIRISPRMRLDKVMAVMLANWGGGTDCAAPMEFARRHKIEADTFIVYTDNETWYGPVHPHQALENYRQATGIDARLQVVATVPTEFSIADPDDPRQLDVSGFDSDVPVLLANHARGDI